MTALEERSASNLEYYVHFVGEDKRNDCWIDFKNVRFTEENVVEEDTKS